VLVVIDLDGVSMRQATEGGHRIDEAEGDGLDEAGEIAVRQITALVPAEEAKGALLVGERTRPAVLVGHQFAQVFAFGSGVMPSERRSPTRRVVQTSLRAGVPVFQQRLLTKKS